MARYDDDDLDDRPRRSREREDNDRDYSPPRKKSSLGLILGIVAGILFLVCGGCGVGLYYARESANRMKASNNCKQMALAAHNYADTYAAFPTNSYSPDGKPLLSWRVHILPYIQQDNLYRQFNLSEPWDGPTNIRLLNQMPRMYAPVSGSSTVSTSQTYLRGFSNPGTMFARMDGKGGLGRKMGGFDIPIDPRSPMGVTPADIRDSQKQTILFLEAGEPVDWTKPDDLDASPGKPFPSLGGARPKADNVMVVFVDGSVRLVKKSIPESTWRAGTTIAGNDAANFD